MYPLCEAALQDGHGTPRPLLDPPAEPVRPRVRRIYVHGSVMFYGKADFKKGRLSEQT